MAQLADVVDATFEQEVLLSLLPVLVDFWADWCGPCKRLHPVLESLADELAGRLRIVRVDAATNVEVTSQQGVLNLPTLILYRQGQEVERFGFVSHGRLHKKLELLLSEG